MWEEAVASWPVIPFSVIGPLTLIAIAGLIAMLYDAGTRDTGRMTQVGGILLGVGIIGCLGVGMWNLTVSVAQLATHQNAYAASAPMRSE